MQRNHYKMHRIVKQLLVLKTHNAPNGCKKLTTCKDSTKSATRTFRSLLRAPIKTYEKHTQTHTCVLQRLSPFNCRNIILKTPNTAAKAPTHFIQEYNNDNVRSYYPTLCSSIN